MSGGRIQIAGAGRPVPRQLSKQVAAAETAEMKQAIAGNYQNSMVLRKMLESQGLQISGNLEALAVLFLSTYGTDDDRERVKEFREQMLAEARKVIENVEEQKRTMDRLVEEGGSAEGGGAEETTE